MTFFLYFFISLSPPERVWQYNICKFKKKTFFCSLSPIKLFKTLFFLKDRLVNPKRTFFLKDRLVYPFNYALSISYMYAIRLDWFGKKVSYFFLLIYLKFVLNSSLKINNLPFPLHNSYMLFTLHAKIDMITKH